MAITIVKNVKLFDGKDVRPDTTVVFDSDAGVIIEVSNNPVSVPADATVVDGSGHTLIPGLIDAHAHTHLMHGSREAMSYPLLEVALQGGITTVCDLHCNKSRIDELWAEIDQEIHQAKQAGAAGRVAKADLKTALSAATIKGGYPKQMVLANHPNAEMHSILSEWAQVTTENAAEYVRQNKADGASYIKLMQEDLCCFKLPPLDLQVPEKSMQEAVIRAAHSENMVVVGHALSIHSTELLLEAGVDGLAHTIMDQRPTDHLVDLYKSVNAFVIPTLTILSGHTGFRGDLREKFGKIGFERGLLNDIGRKTFLETNRSIAPAHVSCEYSCESIRRLHQAGIDVVAGTDAAIGLPGAAFGVGLWFELALYVEECEMSPLDALKTATSVSAKRMGFPDRGTVEVGKRADLVLVKGDVTDKLDYMWEGEGIVKVWKQGIEAALKL